MSVSAINRIKPPKWNYNAGMISAPYNYWAKRAIALFPFSEVGGRVRDYQNKLVATTTGPWITSPFGPAQDFNVNGDKATTSNISLIDSTHITLWVRVILDPGIPSQDSVIQKGWSAHESPFYTWAFLLTAAQYRWVLASASATSTLNSTTNYVTSVWLDFIGTWDGVNQNIWIRRLDNGNTTKSTLAFSGSLRHASNIGITVGGYRNFTEAAHFSIGAVGVWPYGFTDSEVLSFLKDPLGLFRPIWYDFPAIIRAPATTLPPGLGPDITDMIMQNAAMPALVY